ncbi:MAG TPA: ASCH domain-containing protein [Blastocatellia bacterium]|nr:ASCH domain-containing protein [Blastocatellia bacterium]
METLFGLSIQQPWLDMIIRGIKTMELREKEAKRRGIVALHAPWKIDFSAAYFYGYENPWRMHRGKILAVADISDVYELDVLTWQGFLEQHRQPIPFADGSFGIALKNVRVLDRPVACRGKPWFFPLPAAVAERVGTAAHL